MAETLASWFWIILGIYAGLGILFAVYFVCGGAGRVDPVAKQGTWGFKLLIFPGTAALWPLLLNRIRKGLTEPPAESNAHRQAAQKHGEASS